MYTTIAINVSHTDPENTVTRLLTKPGACDRTAGTSVGHAIPEGSLGRAAASGAHAYNVGTMRALKNTNSITCR